MSWFSSAVKSVGNAISGVGKSVSRAVTGSPSRPSQPAAPPPPPKSPEARTYEAPKPPPAPAATTFGAQAAVNAYYDNARKRGGSTIVAGETGGYNPATGSGRLGGSRSVLG